MDGFWIPPETFFVPGNFKLHVHKKNVKRNEEESQNLL